MTYTMISEKSITRQPSPQRKGEQIAMKTETRPTGTIVQSWVSHDLARDLKAQAVLEDRSSSSVIRRAVNRYLADAREREARVA